MKKSVLNMKIPRVMIAAAKSGAGKTTVTCGILEALKEEGRVPCSFKCGPDYIDPMFHRSVLGISSGNLDAYFADGTALRALLARECADAGADIAVIEGVMGYYDGLGGTTSIGSAFHLAIETETPVILVIDAKGASVTIAAEIRGLLTYGAGKADGAHCKNEWTEKADGLRCGKNGTEKADGAHCKSLYVSRSANNPTFLHSGIAGILLNRVSKGFYPRLKELIERECGVPVVGYLPVMKETLSSRHLGLVQPEELPELKNWIRNTAACIRETVDLALVERIAESAPELHTDTDISKFTAAKGSEPLRIAYARDKAFTFSYKENELLLKAMGAELVYFSPLRDEILPLNIDGLILPGGYPELHVRALEANSSMRTSVKEAVKGGLPTIAECGGFLYLLGELEDGDGYCGQMCGVLDGKGKPAGRLQRFGYFEAETTRDGLYGPAGTRLRGHEFHHWDTDTRGDGLLMKKALSERTERAVVYTDTLAAGFPHFYYAAYPDVPRSFLAACRHYRERKKGLT